METENKTICSDCSAQNPPSAKFCEQCGAVLGNSPATGEAGAGNPGSTFNWTGIVIVIIVVGAIFWLNSFMGGKPDTGTQQASTSSSPHSLPSEDGSGMQDVMAVIEQSRGKLEENPLDINALNELYQMYGGIGEPEKVRPYTVAAVDAWQALEEQARDMKRISDIAVLAMQNGDFEGAVVAFESYLENSPENVQVAATIGNLYFQMGRRDGTDTEAGRAAMNNAIDWYTRFLDAGNPSELGDKYWNARIDRASARIALADGGPDTFEAVIEDLREVTEQAPDYWMGWHSLGLAQKLAGHSEDAIETLHSAKEHASSGRERWESEQQLAILEGREADPGDYDPTNPHAELDMDSMDLPDAAPGMPNPHGGSGDSGTVPENPHNIGTQG